MKAGREVRSGVREQWNSAAAGWKKWDPKLMEWLAPVGKEILELAELRDDYLVLDVATGSGEPGLSAARRLKRGSVVGIDVSEAMASTAKEKAVMLGITNYEVRVYGGDRLPFDDNRFDAVVSRFGVMFFPDVAAGLREMVRVLKPGRKLCTAVWGPQNEAAKAVMRVMDEELGLPETPLDSPNPFRCSESGRIERLLREAGLRGVGLREVPTLRSYRSSGEYWEYLMDMNPDIAEAFEGLDPAGKGRARTRVLKILDGARSKGDQIELPSVAWVGHGTK